MCTNMTRQVVIRAHGGSDHRRGGFWAEGLPYFGGFRPDGISSEEDARQSRQTHDTRHPHFLVLVPYGGAGEIIDKTENNRIHEACM